MKIGIPIWNNRISPVMDTARYISITELENGREKSHVCRELEDKMPSKRAQAISRLGVEVLICGAASIFMVEALDSFGIKVIPWITGERDDVVRAYLENRLTDARFCMPGCQRRRAGNCRRRRRSSPPQNKETGGKNENSGDFTA